LVSLGAGIHDDAGPSLKPVAPPCGVGRGSGGGGGGGVGVGFGGVGFGGLVGFDFGEVVGEVGGGSLRFILQVLGNVVT
jgi:hypothetical protein